MARHFQFKVKIFFKEIILDGPLGKTKYYAISIEFQESGSSHVHLFLNNKCLVARPFERSGAF